MSNYMSHTAFIECPAYCPRLRDRSAGFSEVGGLQPLTGRSEGAMLSGLNDAIAHLRKDDSR